MIVSITTCRIAYLWGKLPVSRDIGYWDPNLKFKDKTTLIDLNN